MKNKTDNLTANYNSFSLPILWAQVSLLVIVFVYSYKDVLSSLVKTWLGRDDYSHGFLVPFICLYLIWDRRDKLRYISIKPNFLGGVFLTLLGSILFLSGSVGGVLLIQYIALMIVVPGLVLLLLGLQYLKTLTFPLSYLILMLPIMDGVLDKIRWPSQLFSATMTAALLKLFKISVLQHDNYLELPNVTLEVARECSGVQYMFSIIAIAIPLAYLTLRKWWQRVILLSLAVVISLIGNVLRITLISLWSFKGGDIHGPYHVFQGLFVSAIGFIFLFIGAWGLNKIQSSNFNFKKPTIIKEALTDSFSINIKQFNRVWVLAIVILTGVGGYLYLYRPQPIPLRNSIIAFPNIIKEWTGDEYKQLFRVNGADYEITKAYKNLSGDRIMLYAGYFEFQNQNKELIHYSLQKIYKNSEVIEISIGLNNSIRVNKTILRENEKNFLVLSWYDLNGRIVASNYEAKLLTTLDGFIHGRTNGAVVVIYSELSHPDNLKELLNNETTFIREIFPILRNYLP